MTRENDVSKWLGRSNWSKWTLTPIAGDASSRKYHRLTRDGDSLILMDAPPKTCGSQSQFVAIANWLCDLGLSAPKILSWDDEIGLMILEDLGATDFAKHLQTSANDEQVLYQHALHVLSQLSRAKPPSGLTEMTPEFGADMIDLAFDWAAYDNSADLAKEIKSRTSHLLATYCGAPTMISLRDFHAQNLIWRPNQSGVRRVGLLDFQDAFLSHPMYDVASLLRDARRDVDPALTDIFVTNPTDRAAFHVLALQRNLRILGIFNRLAKKDSKTGYLSLLPRVWSHIQTDLMAPETKALAPLINAAFEVPK